MDIELVSITTPVSFSRLWVHNLLLLLQGYISETLNGHLLLINHEGEMT